MHPHSPPHAHPHGHRRPVPLGFTPDSFPEGTHICYLYSDEEERRRFMSKYAHAGFEVHECVTYLADTDNTMLERAAEELGILPDEGPQEQLTLRTSMETYCPDGQFIKERMLGKLRDAYLGKPPGCVGARLGAEMTWALRGLPGSEQLVEYEGLINILLKKYPLTTLCQYDTRKFSGEIIFRLLNVHPIMVVQGQIMSNPFYIPPDPTAQLKLP